MTEPLDVGRLRLLREVELRGSIAAAARALALTPSAVSQQLVVLEREAGTPLLDRSSRGVALTGAGHLLARHAAGILDQLADARADLDRLGGETAGPVTVAAVASAAATVVSMTASDLRRTHPGIELRVIAAEPARSVALLAAGDVDVAIVDEYDYVPLALPDYAYVTELMTEPLVAVCAPQALRRRRSVGAAGLAIGLAIELTELATFDWVMPPQDAACGMAVRAACRTAGFEPRVRWETDDMLLLVRAVAAGHGVTVLPGLAVAADAADVVIHPLRAPVLQRRLSAVVRASAKSRPIVREVLAALVTASAAASATGSAAGGAAANVGPR